MSAKNVIGVAFGGKVSTHSLLANAANEADSIRSLIVIAINDRDEVRVGTTHGSRCELLGMLRVAEDHLLETMKER